MGRGSKSCDESLVGRRVKVCWPKQKAPPKWDASKAYGDELVGCKVKVWRLKSSTFSEGVVASYNHSNKIHKVVYTDGVEEMLNLTKHVETAEDVSADQAKTTDSPAREFSSMNTDDDMDADLHARKKHKGPSSVRTTRLASPVLSKDLKTPKLEADISPTDSKLSSITGDDDLLNVNAYKVKASAAPILEVISKNMGILQPVVYSSQHPSELLYLKLYVMLFRSCSTMTLKPFYLILKI
ncbi:hypothetical protein ACS0TY_035006 [Phlomoides rotata]